MPTTSQLLSQLKAKGSKKNVAGMQRFGIRGSTMYGVSMPNIRAIGKGIGHDHALALQLWKTSVHEARILATIIAEPTKVTRPQMERWVKDLDSWDVCDNLCLNLLYQMPWAFTAALQWSKRPEEFVKRAGFALMAGIAWHHKTATDKQFAPCFGVIVQQSHDDRPMVRKAVNWALRQIGKRNRRLNTQATKLASQLKSSSSKAARWIGSDAYRELTNAKVRARLRP